LLSTTAQHQASTNTKHLTFACLLCPFAWHLTKHKAKHLTNAWINYRFLFFLLPPPPTKAYSKPCPISWLGSWLKVWLGFKLWFGSKLWLISLLGSWFGFLALV
jgi:hypothetical protein